MAETKLYLNIQEQVEKNKNDIKFMLEEEGTLNKFGIKVIGQEDDVSDIPSVDDYKEDHEDWAYGDAYAIGTEAPYTLYILTRANGTHPNDYWFNIGQFPVPGPQGETGEQGPAGHTPQVTVATPVTNTLPAGSSASASVMNVGTADDPQLAFSFDIPKGDKGDTGATGEPGAFHLNGQVASAALLPDASLVDADAAYAVGSELPYDIYVIMTVGGVQSWLNIGPVLTALSDTKLIVNEYTSAGTLTQEQLDAIVNETNMDFLKIGTMLFTKAAPGEYYAILKQSTNPGNPVNIYKLFISLEGGTFVIVTEEVIDERHNQTITGYKTFSNGLSASEIDFTQNPSSNYIKCDTAGILIRAGGNDIRLQGRTRPQEDNQVDFGRPTLRWKDLYLAGKISDGTNEVTIADLAALITYAKGQGWIS